jgi:hypothetical protein
MKKKTLIRTYTNVLVSFNVHRTPYITQYIRDQDFAATSSSPSFGSTPVAFSRSMAVRLVLDLAVAVDSLGCIKNRRVAMGYLCQ